MLRYGLTGLETIIQPKYYWQCVVYVRELSCKVDYQNYEQLGNVRVKIKKIEMKLKDLHNAISSQGGNIGKRDYK